MSKKLSIFWLILPLLLTSCSKEVWHKNIESVSKEFAPLDTILFIALLAGIVILFGYFLLSKCLIPYFASTRSRSPLPLAMG